MSDLRGDLADGISSVATRYGLPRDATAKLGLLLQRLAEEPLAPTSIRDPWKILDHHIADSLVALELEPVRMARSALDLGSGPGMPGLPLAIALPGTSFALLESNARKCVFLEHTARACGITNVQVVNARAESYAARERFDLVTARAVSRLEVNAEYAAPLLRVGGRLVAWAGELSGAERATAVRAAGELGLEGLETRRVEPFPEANNRYLYLLSKVRETPTRFPRRPGIAAKRPLGGPDAAPRASDRFER